MKREKINKIPGRNLRARPFPAAKQIDLIVNIYK